MKILNAYITRRRVFISSIVILLLPIIFAVSLNVPAFFDKRVYPFTYAASVELGGLNVNQAQKIITENIEKFLKTPFFISYEGRGAFFTPRELGIIIDYKSITGSLPLVNKENPGEFYRNLLVKNIINLEPLLDYNRLQEGLQNKFPNIKKGRNAYFVFDENKNLKIIPEENFIRIDFKKFKEDFSENLNSLNSGMIKLAYKEQKPTVTASRLEAEKEGVIAKLKKPIALKYENKVIQVIPWEHLDWIGFEEYLELNLKIAGLNFALKFPENKEIPPNLPIENNIKIIINAGQFKEFISQTLDSGIKVDKQDVKIYFAENENIVFEGTALDGQAIESEKLRRKLELAINHNISEVAIPVQIQRAQVYADEKLAQMGVKELIGMGYTDYSGSPANRIHNIGVGMDKLNGLLMAPGQTVSFLDSIGHIGAETGYLKELVINKNETIPDYGGGICQVSSTLYRAALFSGLPIAQRQAHSYAVSYYFKPLGAGLDATVFQPAPDLKFVNDTASHILVQGYTHENKAYFKFYGTSDDRVVQMDGPYESNPRPAPADEIEYTDQLAPGQRKQLDRAHAGFDVRWYRTIYKNGEEIKEEIFSRYRAWPAKILVGAEKAEE